MIDLSGKELEIGQRVVTNSSGDSDACYPSKGKLSIKTVVAFTEKMVKLSPGDRGAEFCNRAPYNVAIIEG